MVFGKAGGFAANLNLSALDGTNGFKISGDASGDYSGYSVASAGDVNGDGFADLVIGAYGASKTGSSKAGATYVVFGATGGFGTGIILSTMNGANGFRINGEAANDRSGNAVASAGDLNGDGFDDIVIGASRADPNGTGSGASYVLFGKATQATAGNDRLIGHDGAETLNGVDGNDSLFGMGGDDQLVGGAGNDVLDGGTGNDVMFGGAGNDVFIFDSAGDQASDASGIDEVQAAFALDLTATGFETLENATLLGALDLALTGDSGANVLTGNTGRNTVSGGAGADTLRGGAGNDTLTGNAGADVLTGEADRDVFKFIAMADLTASAATTDVITDFKRGTDKIDLSVIDASTSLGGNNKFTFDGKTAHGTSKEGDVFFKQVNNAGTSNDFTLIFIDSDADKASEAILKVMGLHSFTASDFIL